MQRRYSPAVQEDMERRARIRQRVAEMYEAGKKDIQIAAELGLTESQVRHCRMRMGLRSKLRGYLSSVEIAEREEAAIDERDIDLCAIVFGLAAIGVHKLLIAQRAGISVEETERYIERMPANWRSWGDGCRPPRQIGVTGTKLQAGTRRGKIRRMIGEY